MRDKKRIDEFLKELGKVWKKNPDLRFGQLLENIMINLGNIWYLEDEYFLKQIKKFNNKEEKDE